MSYEVLVLGALARGGSRQSEVNRLFGLSYHLDRYYHREYSRD